MTASRLMAFDSVGDSVMPLSRDETRYRSMLLTFSSIVDTANINESNTRGKSLSKTRSPNAGDFFVVGHTRHPCLDCC